MRRRWLLPIGAVALAATLAVVATRSRMGAEAPAPSPAPAATTTAVSVATPAPASAETPAPVPQADPVAVVAAAIAAHPPDAAPAGAPTIQGVVVDPEGRPVAGEGVTALSDADGEVDDASTGDDGAFALAVPAGHYDLEVEADGFAPTRVAVRAPARGVRIVLSRGATIEGVLLDATGAPVEGALAFVSEGGDGDADDAGQLRGSAETDAGGRFRIGALAPGRYDVRAGRVTLDLAAAPAVAGNLAREHVTLAREATVSVTLRLDLERTLAGVVVDEAGAAIAEAQVWATRVPAAGEARVPGIPAQTVSDAQGRFALHGLADGEHQLMALREGFALADRELRARADDRDVRVVLRRVPLVRGRVVGEDGAPVTRFTVNLHPFEDSDGRFEIPVDREGKLALHVVAKGHAPLSHAVEVTRRASVDVGDLRLARARSLAGRVVDAESGAPVAGARVVTRMRAVRRWMEVDAADAPVTGADGRFTVPDVGDGVQLRVTRAGYGPATVEVAPGQASAEVRLRRGARISVRVLDAAGAPLRRVGVMVVAVADEPEPSAAGEVDAEGRWTAGDLAPGTYLVAPLFPGGDRPAIAGRTVTVAAGETVDVELRERGGGVDVVVRLTGPGAARPGELGVALASGDATGIRTMRDVLTVIGTAQLAPDGGPEATFRRVEPGRHTVLVLGGDPDAPSVLARTVEVGHAPEQVIELEVPETLPLLLP